MSSTVLNGGASAQDFNSTTYVVAKFDVEEDNEGTELTSDTVTDNKITVASAGHYRMSAAITFTSSSARVTPSVSFNINQVRIIGEAYGYIRATNGQNENACNITRVIALSAGDEIQVCAHDTSTVNGSCFAVEAIFEVEKLAPGIVGATGATGPTGPAAGLAGEVLEIELSDVALTNGVYEGLIMKYGSSTLSSTVGKVYVYTSSGWSAADASAASTTKGTLGLNLGTNSGTDGLITQGFITTSAYNTAGWTAGDVLYLDVNAEQMTNDVSSFVQNDCVRVLGQYIGSGLVHFNPSADYIELA
jgi:hypothetical protein